MPEITITPINGKIKYEIKGQVWCSRMKAYIPNSNIYDKEDLTWLRLFGSQQEVNEFVSQNKPIIFDAALSDLGYDKCDKIRFPSAQDGNKSTLERGAQDKNQNAYKGLKGKDIFIWVFPQDTENLAILKKAYGKSPSKIIRKLIQDDVDRLNKE